MNRTFSIELSLRNQTVIRENQQTDKKISIKQVSLNGNGTIVISFPLVVSIYISLLIFSELVLQPT